jgi:glycosyltransferase involved in cell wall biosynthesis
MIKSWLAQVPLKGSALMNLPSGKKFRNEGDFARDNKDWEAAAQSYRRYLDVSPDDSAIWVQLGHAEKEQGHLDKAEQAYRKATTLAPLETDSRLHLAHVLKRLGRPKQAAAIFQEIMKITPTTAILDELKALGYGQSAIALMDRIQDKKSINVRYIELKDLLQYLNLHTTVTGITRVVLALINYVLEEMDESEAEKYHFVQMYGDAEGVILIPKFQLRRILDLAIGASDIAAMQALIAEIRQTSPIIQFNLGDTYCVVGAFWEFSDNPTWLNSMRQKGVYVGVYIYDLIPITHAHYCMSALTEAFSAAFAETCRFADFTLTISDFVAKQVIDFVRIHNIQPFPVVPVTLAKELHFDLERDTAPSTAEASMAAIEELEDRPFVLCVCTIEARKNHIYLFYIWQQMIDAGIDVPDLVFVGRCGWRVNDLLSQISASRNLGGRLHLMQGLTDTELGQLYKRCLFTAFPSFVEGWGLPVGESLAYGKVCVASSAASIPEVGGEFAVYVDPFNLASGYEAIRRLIVDPGHLAALEAKIRQKFVPRTWHDVGRDFYQAVNRVVSSLPPPEPGRPGFAPYVKAGRMLEMRSAQQDSRRLAQYADNPTRLLFVHGWRTFEVSGTWMKDSHARARVRTDYEIGRAVSILLEVSTSPWINVEKNTLRVWASDAPTQRIEVDGEDHYIRPMRENSRFWIRLKGYIGPRNLITIQFKIDGAVSLDGATSETTIPVALRLHALGFSATDDCITRLDLLEQASLAPTEAYK